MKKKNDLLSFVTGNTHKFDEVQTIFKNYHLTYKLKQIDLNPIEIQADSIQKVAEYKLNSVKSKIDGSFFIEDAGLFIDYPLNGFPGIYSSYVFKTLGNKSIIRLIDDFENSKAHFSAIIALYFEPEDQELFFKGKIEGRISSEIRGTQGFGYDPIFIPNEIPDKTFGELSVDQKNTVSHRGRALEKLINFLKKHSFSF
ncbi:MAG: XTP/dITP diphosphatase [Promethearchaeati archaeon]